MRYSIVYSSQTGNTALLAETVRASLPPADCIYYGAPSAAALKADRIYLGFWTDKGICDNAVAAFLKTLTHQQVFLFGTAGFGPAGGYHQKILDRVSDMLPDTVTVIGRYLCQGKMPMSVRTRYELLLESGVPHAEDLLDNFDEALSHPDERDLQVLRDAVRIF